MAAAPVHDYSDLVADAAHWTNHDPDYAALLGAVGAGAGADRADAARSLVNMAVHTPTVIVFRVNGDNDNICVGYNPTFYPTDVTHATPFDNLVVMGLGNCIERSLPIVMHANMFGRTNNRHVYTYDYVIGPNGHGHAGPVFQFSPPLGGTRDTSQVRARRAMLVPPALAEQVLQGAPDGVYSLLGFSTQVLQPELDSGDADRVARIDPLRDWYRVAVSDDGAGALFLGMDQVVGVNPVNERRLVAYHRTLADRELLKFGVGGPALSNAEFQRGITNLQTTLTTNTTSR